jgi:hypothetical protein
VKEIMINPQYPASHTSNDLLFNLEKQDSEKPLNCGISAQSAEEVQDPQNAPAISMGPYLIESGQTQLWTTVSIYAQRGEVRAQARLLYMNDVAFSIADIGRPIQ